jgi:universal stress protein E
MNAFRNILVGIDLDPHGELAAGSRAAVDKAIWLASKAGAQLTFVHVIDLPESVGEVMRIQPQSEVAMHLRGAADLLEGLVAAVEGGKARAKLLYGKHWQQLIAEAQHGGHNLVLLGTRGRGITGRALFGSTVNKLLRHCPCPVWTVKPGAASLSGPILVAHDLSEVGAMALQTGAVLARLQGCALHVLHVLEHPEERSFLGSISSSELNERRNDVLAEIERQCRALNLLTPATISVRDGSAHAAILDHTSTHQVELLCMGTVARSGLAGFITGNTAENVLPWLQCSLLAVKPTDFVSPLAATAEVISSESSQRKTPEVS